MRPDPDLSPYRVTLSIGLAAFLPGTDSQTLIREAGAAIYRAKRQGRNRICVAEIPGRRPKTSPAILRRRHGDHLILHAGGR